MGLIIDPNTVSLLYGVEKRPNEPVYFCDESGRSGPNYIDPDQPLFVLAGYLVPEDKYGVLLELLKEVRRAAGIDQGELKFGRLQGTARARTALSRFICQANKVFPPIAVAVEKRYFAGIKLCTIFLDRHFNDRAPVVDVQDAREADRAKQRAEVLATLPDGALERLRMMLAEPTAESVLACFDATTGALRNAGHEELANMLEGARPNLGEVARALEAELSLWDVYGPQGGTLRMGSHLDLDAFGWCFDELNGLLANLGVKRAHIICDQAQGQRAHERLFLARRFGNRQRPPLPAQTLHFANSADVPGLQAADLLVSSVRLAVLGGWKPELQDAVDSILLTIYSSPPKWRFFGGPSAFKQLMVKVAASWRRRQEVRSRLIGLLKSRVG